MRKSIAGSVRDLSKQVEAGLLSNIINKIKSSFMKIPQAQEVMKMLSGLNSDEAIGKLIKAIGGKIDRKTYEEAQALLNAVQSKTAAEDTKTLFEKFRDVKKVVMAAVLIMFISGVAGKAMGQSFEKFNADFENYKAKTQSEFSEYQKSQDKPLDNDTLKQVIKDPPKEVKVDVKTVKAPSEKPDKAKLEAVRDSIINNDINHLSKLVKNPIGITIQGGHSEIGTVMNAKMTLYKGINDGLVKAIKDTGFDKEFKSKYSESSLQDIFASALVKKVMTDEAFLKAVKKTSLADDLKNFIEDEAKSIAHSIYN